MSGMNVNGPNNIFGAGQIKRAGAVQQDEFLNTVFNSNGGKFVPNTPFKGEEQHVLGIFANAQNNVLIED